MIELTLHPAKFTSKPIGKEAALISNGIAKYTCTISPNRFKHSLENGQTWSALFANKRNIDNWLGQQLFAADIDKGNRSLAELQALCELHCIEPFIIHESFSSSDEARKWRIIFKTAELIDDICLATGIQRKLVELFGGDSAVTDVARLFYGTNKPIAYFNKPALLNTEELGELNTAIATKVNTKALDPISDDWVQDQNTIFEILLEDTRYEKRLELINIRLTEAEQMIKTIGKGSGYESVLHAAIKLAQLKELLQPYIEKYITQWVDDCEEYAHGTWQHRHKLDELIDTGIRLGRNRLYG